MIGTMAAVGCACMGALYLSTTTRSERAKSKPRRYASRMAGSRVDPHRAPPAGVFVDYIERPVTRQPIQCPPLPWLPEQVDGVLAEALDQGLRNERALVLMALHTVYDETIDGIPISWPARPNDCAALKAIEERVRIRVRHVLAALEDEEADRIYTE